MKKVLAFLLLASFISAAGLIFSGCSGDKKNNVTNGGGSTPVYSFEGTWNCGGQYFQFTGTTIIFVAGGNPSYKGTFTYDSTGNTIACDWTDYAVGDAITGSVTWSTYTGGYPFWSPETYSFIDENTVVINGDTYTKVS